MRSHLIGNLPSLDYCSDTYLCMHVVCMFTFTIQAPVLSFYSGGIRLTFSGCNLNVLQQPSLVLTGSRRRQTGLVRTSELTGLSAIQPVQ